MSSVGGLSVELELNGDGTFTSRVIKAGDALDDLESKAYKATSAINDLPPVFSKVSGGFDSLVNRVTHASFAINEFRDAAYTMYEMFGGLVEKIVDVNANIEKITATFRGMSTATTEIGRTTDALRDLNSVMNMAASSPFSLDKLAHGLVQLKNTNLDDPAKALREVADAVAHFGGGDEELDRVTLAMQQMAGKGVVSLEELRQQMGEALPGAMQAMANGMNISVATLMKMITTGTVESKNAMARMLDEFDRMYGGQSSQKMQTFSGQVSVLSTNLQKAALAAGGMNLDGSYDDFSSYTAITNVLKNLNDTLSSPEMRRAAVEMNDNLRQVANVFAELAKNTDDWMNKLIKFGEIAITTVAVLKAIRLAAVGVNAVGGLLGATRLGAEVASAGTTRSAGNYLGMASPAIGRAESVSSFSKIRSVAADIAEQGAGDYLFTKAPAAFNAMKTAGVASLNAIRVAGTAAGDALAGGLFNVMTKIAAAGTEGAGFTAIASGIGAAIIPLIPEILAAAAAFGTLYGAYRLWKNLTSGTGADTSSKEISNVMKGVTDDDSVKNARSEISEAEQKRQAALDAIDQINKAKSGQTNKPYLPSLGSFGDAKGVSSPFIFGRLASPSERSDDSLDALKTKYQTYYQQISAQIAQDSTGVDAAIDKSLSDQADKLFNGMQAVVDKRLTSVRNNYSKQMKAISDDRAKYENNVDSDSVKRVSDDNAKARSLRIDEDNARLTEQETIVTDLEKQISSLGNVDLGSANVQKLGKALTEAKDKVASMRKEFAESERAAGTVVTATAGSIAAAQEKRAQTVIQNLQQKISAAQDAMNESDIQAGNGGKVSVGDNLRAQLAAGGSLAGIGDDSRAAIMSLIDSLEQMNKKLENSRAIASDFASLMKETADSTKRAMAVLNAAPEDNVLGSGYQSRVATIQSQRNDILSRSNVSISDQNLASSLGSGADAFQLVASNAQLVADAYAKVTSATDSASSSTLQFTPALIQSSIAMSDGNQKINDLLFASGSIPENMKPAADGLGLLGNAAIDAAGKANSLKVAIDAVNRATEAVQSEKIASSLEAASSWAASARAKMVSLESPAQRLKDTISDIDNKSKSLQENADLIGSKYGDAAKQKYLNDVKTAAANDTTAARSQYAIGSSKANHTEVNELQQLRASNAQLQAQLDGTGTTYAKYYSIIKNGAPAEKAHAQELLSAAQLHDQLTERVKRYNAAQEMVTNYTKQLTRDTQAAAEAQNNIFTGEGSSLANQMTSILAKQSAAMQAIAETTKDAAKAEKQRQDVMKETQALQQKALALAARDAEQSARTMNRNNALFLTDRRAAAVDQVNQTHADELNQVNNSGLSEEDKRKDALAFNDKYSASMRQAIRQTEGPLEQLSDKWMDINNNLQSGLSSTFSTLTDDMVDALNGATVSWKSFGKSVMEMLEKIAIQWAASFALQKLGMNMTNSGSSGSSSSGIMGGISSVLSGLGSISGLFGGGSAAANSAATAAANADSIAGNYTVGAVSQVPLHHSGGIVGAGEALMNRTVPASLFNNARKYHTGGLAGDEVPAILQRGEGVFTKGQMAAIGKLASGSDSVVATSNTATNSAAQMAAQTPSAPKITMNVKNQTNGQVSAESSQPRFDGDSWIIDTVIKHVQSPGRLRNALKTAK